MTSNSENQITRSDLIKSAVNTGALGMEFSWTYYKQMNIAFCLMVANMLKKIYAGRPDDYAEALHRHSAFFNITPQLAPFVGGIAMAMEEKVARGEVEPESVNDIKAALMGPLSGLGDSFFLSTLRVVAAAVGISLCQAGNVFGPIAFLLVYNIPAFLIRIFGAIKGYELGIGFLDEAQKTGLMQKIMACVGIVGVMVVGAMSRTCSGLRCPSPLVRATPPRLSRTSWTASCPVCSVWPPSGSTTGCSPRRSTRWS